MLIALSGLFILANFMILLYALSQARLAYLYRRPAAALHSEPQWPGDLPFVTVQLPVYNEVFVIERLLKAVEKLDYPRDRLDIQVLDDSTDETTEIIAASVERMKQAGLTIAHIQRPGRIGFKAGALEFGLETARGEFIAIFDADFVPGPDILLRLLPHFAGDKVGAVQARWTHLNRNSTLFTRIYAFALDTHFSVEQAGRARGGHFSQFNGTAGILRRSMIADAGGWQHDTLVEDFDLSLRAQLRGWTFKYIEDVEAPAELPVTINDIKGQQRRWIKGNAETARKLFTKILAAPLPLETKFHALMQLIGASTFISVLISTTLTAPLVMYAQRESVPAGVAMGLAQINLLALISIHYYAWVSWFARHPFNGLHSIARFQTMVLSFLAISLAIAPNNALAATRGYMGIRSPFVRTAKVRATGTYKSWRDRTKYLQSGLTALNFVELALACYFIAMGVVAALNGVYFLVFFQGLFAFGYITVLVVTLREHFRY